MTHGTDAAGRANSDRPVELETTLEPNLVLMVVVMATACRCESMTERWEVPWSSGFMACAYCPPYAVKSRVELSVICSLCCMYT